MKNLETAVIVVLVLTIAGLIITKKPDEETSQLDSLDLSTTQQSNIDSNALTQNSPSDPVETQPNTPQEDPSNINTQPKGTMQQPDMIIDSSKSYTATLKTSEGDITIRLNTDTTPITANNFVYLSREGFYDGTIFHRVIDGFMIQGGDPNGNGTGGPGYKFADEPFEGEYTRGTVAMANSGPNTNGSQFFIMHKDYGLPKNYVIFGEVVEGLEVVDKIATAEVTTSATGENSKPVNPVTVEKVTIEEK